MLKCKIFVNGYYSNQSIVHQSSRMAEEFNNLGVQAEIVKTNTVSCGVDGFNSFTTADKPDFVVFFDKDRYMAEALERSGVKVFNSMESIVLCDDKMLTYFALSGNDIPMPYTIASPIMYYDAKDVGFTDKIIDELGLPVIVKSAYGSMGKGVFMASNKFELDVLHEKLKLVPHLYQKPVGKLGQDTRVICVGGKAVASMTRVNENDFRSNIGHGGKAYKCELTSSQKALAEKASVVLGLDYCGVDILTENGVDYICEVNSNAFFEGIESVTGVNVAKIYAEHILKSIKGE